MAKSHNKPKSNRSLWLAVAAGAMVCAGLGYMANPMAVQQAIPSLQCWWSHGVYLRSTAAEGSYARMMNQNPLNAQRLNAGTAQGCYPAGGCVATAEEAVKLLEEQMLGWAGIQGGNLIKGNVLGMLGLKSEADARAHQNEADFCFKYLANQRNNLRQH